jgi:hypothetical protein
MSTTPVSNITSPNQSNESQVHPRVPRNNKPVQSNETPPPKAKPNDPNNEPRTPRTREIENLLSTECDVIEFKVNPRIVPFLTAIEPGEKNMAAYIAPINHNRIDSKMVASLISTMTGNYCRDSSMDNTHLQDMGSDAAVLLGYYDKSETTKKKMLSN